MTEIVALDIETTGLDPQTDTIHGVGIGDADGEEYITRDTPSTRYNLSDLLRNPDRHIVGHNIRFDLKFLVKAGYEINCNVWDTKILAQLIDENQELGLKALAEKYIGREALTDKRDLDRAISKAGVRHIGEFCRLDLEQGGSTEIIAKYCKEDCRNTLQLWKKLIPELKHIAASWEKLKVSKTPLDYFVDEAIPLERVLVDMELHGIAFDVAACQKYRKQLVTENSCRFNQLNELCLNEIQAIEEKLYEDERAKRKSEKGKANVQKSSDQYGTRFNWQSTDHVRTLFFSYLGTSIEGVTQTPTGQPSIGEESLEYLVGSSKAGSRERRIFETFAGYKKTQKLITTYTGEEKGLLSHVQNGRIYGEYLQAGRGKDGTVGGTVTGRLSSRNPNMQNLPRGSEIKKFFIPDPGHAFIYFDYSQLELRLAAHLSQDALLLAAYRNDKDLHQQTANELGITRQEGKTCNFAVIYDASAWRLSSILNLPVERCEEIRQNWFQLYAGYAEYLQEQRRFMESYGCLISAAGRVRRLPALIQQPPPSYKDYNHMIKQGYNFPIQSLGATITKRAMIALHEKGYHLVTQVHDSVVAQVPLEQVTESKKEIQQIAESIYPLTIPLKCDIKVLKSLSEEDKYED